MSDSVNLTPDVHVRAKVEKFDGKGPTKANNALRILALMGPKLPKEIVIFDDLLGTWSEPPPSVGKFWLTQRVVDWYKAKRRDK